MRNIFPSVVVLVLTLGCSANGGTATFSAPSPEPAQPSGPTAEEQNGYGGSGQPLDSGVSSSFAIFQPNFVSKLLNGDGGAVKASGVASIYAMGAFVDPNDDDKMKYFVVDRANHRILIFSSLPASSSAVPDVVVGQADFTSNSANAGQAGPVGYGVNDPVGVSVCTDGKLMISDRNNHRVLVWNQIPQSNGATADFAIGQPSLTSNTPGTTATTLRAPYSASCMAGKLFVADRDNHRVLIFNSLPTNFAPAADLAIGQTDLTTGTSGCAANKFNLPYELLLHDSKLYVTDGGNHRVLAFNVVPVSSGASADVVIGQADMSTTCGINRGAGAATTTQKSMHFPNTLAAKGSTLAVGDHSNNRVLFYNLPLTSDVAPYAQHGQPDFTSNTLIDPPTENSVSNVRGLIFEGTEFIWIGDGGNRRLKVVHLP